jgi:hypothetical protein
MKLMPRSIWRRLALADPTWVKSPINGKTKWPPVLVRRKPGSFDNMG